MSDSNDLDCNCMRRYHEEVVASHNISKKKICYWSLFTGSVLGFGGFCVYIRSIENELPKELARLGFFASSVGISVSAAAVLNLLFLRNSSKALKDSNSKCCENSNTAADHGNAAIPANAPVTEVPFPGEILKSLYVHTELNRDSRQKMQENIQECDPLQTLPKGILRNPSTESQRFSSTVEPTPLSRQPITHGILGTALYKQIYSLLLDYEGVQQDGNFLDVKIMDGVELYRMLNKILDNFRKEIFSFSVENEKLTNPSELCHDNRLESVEVISPIPRQRDNLGIHSSTTGYIAAPLAMYPLSAVSPQKDNVEYIIERIEKKIEHYENHTQLVLAENIDKILEQYKEKADREYSRLSFNSGCSTRRGSRKTSCNSPVLIVLDERTEEDLKMNFGQNCKGVNEVEVPRAMYPCDLSAHESNAELTLSDQFKADSMGGTEFRLSTDLKKAANRDTQQWQDCPSVEDLPIVDSASNSKLEAETKEYINFNLSTGSLVQEVVIENHFGQEIHDISSAYRDIPELYNPLSLSSYASNEVKFRIFENFSKAAETSKEAKKGTPSKVEETQFETQNPEVCKEGTVTATPESLDVPEKGDLSAAPESLEAEDKIIESDR